MSGAGLLGAGRWTAAGRLAAGLGAWAGAERGRFALWLPVWLGAGIALYFALPVEPAAWIGSAALAAAALLLIPLRGAASGLLLALPLAALALGFTAAQLRTALVAAPVLAEPLRGAVVGGRVAAVERLPEGGRLLLTEVTVAGLEPGAMPARLRIRLTAKAPLPPVGSTVRLRADLQPPAPPAAPGAFDYARQAYFDRLGGTGFAFGAPEVVARAPEGWGFSFESLRETIAARIDGALSGPSAPLAAALLTGERAAIPAKVLDDMRDAGLAHLLAISGMNIGIVAGLVFFVIRALGALSEPLALRRPLKKWAAVGALVAALLYTLLVDAPVTALRAFVMSAIMLGAVLADREPLSMRLVAWSAAALLLTAPEVLLGASFQLSFAAVVPLVAVYEVLRRRQALRPKPGIAGRGLIYLRDLVLASAVASAATTPIGAYHFNQGALYGLVANLLAVPLNGAWVMPWGLLAYLLMPFGLEALALVPMGWGLDATLWIAAKVAAWPQAEFLAPAAPAASLALFALGGLWLCLWQSRLRLFGLLPMALAFALGAAAPKPDILVNNDGQLVAVRGADGRLMLSDLRRDRLDAETWLRRNAQAKAERFPKDGETAGKWLRCDDQACLYRRGPWAVALVRRAEALAEDCRIADIVISAVPVRMPCPALLVVDPGSLRDTGALAIGLRGLDPTVETVAAARGRRPWTGRP